MRLLATATILAIFSLSDSPAQNGAHTARIARELAEEGDHLLAAVEYRRMGMYSSDDNAAAGYYWAAAYEYWLADNHSSQSKDMLAKAEHLSPALFEESMLLSAHQAIDSGNLAEAVFYLEAVAESIPEKPATDYAVQLKNFTGLRLAEAHFSANSSRKAEEIIRQLPAEIKRKPLAAVRSYRRGKDKNPVLGGILGLVPGLGYAYSKEYGNALRSLILNGLFIFAMSDTAANDQWGAFTALSFFEITWYTGSIYGGIDAAHRYNKDRFQECLHDIRSEGSFSVDRMLLPLVRLDIQFGGSE